MEPSEKKECLYTNVNLCEVPEVKKHGGESPESKSELSRKSFFAHKTHLFVITSAGKPVYTRHGDEKGVSALSATFAAIIPKLQNQFYDQNVCSTRNMIRYIRMGDMLAVYLFRRNLVYICMSKGGYSYTFMHSLLEFLHIQVCINSRTSIS